MSEDKTLCYCKKVSLSTVEESVKSGANTVEEVQEQTGAGSGCGKCKGLIQEVIDKNKE